MARFQTHPVVEKIVENLRALDLPHLFWTGDILVASLTGECQSNTVPENVCIALHFNFDHADGEYGEDLQIVGLESCVRGRGTALVEAVMKALHPGMRVCVYDATEGSSEKFWPKMAARHEGLVLA